MQLMLVNNISASRSIFSLIGISNFEASLSKKQSMFCGRHFEHSEKNRDSVKLEGEMLGVVSLEIS